MRELAHVRVASADREPSAATSVAVCTAFDEIDPFAAASMYASRTASSPARGSLASSIRSLDQLEMSRTCRADAVVRPRPDAVEDRRIDDVRFPAAQAAEERPRDSSPSGRVEPRVGERFVGETERIADADTQPLEVSELDRELVAARALGWTSARRRWSNRSTPSRDRAREWCSRSPSDDGSGFRHERDRQQHRCDQHRRPTNYIHRSLVPAARRTVADFNSKTQLSERLASGNRAAIAEDLAIGRFPAVEE